MKPIRRTLLSIALALCLFCMTVFALVPGASAHTAARNQVSSKEDMLHSNEVYLGGLDLNGYCQSFGMNGVVLAGSTAGDWLCVDQNGRDWAFSMEDACRWQYSDGHAEDRVGNFNDPYSASCFTNASNLGGLDLNSYCQSLNYTGVSLDGSTVYDWSCVDQNGNHIPFALLGLPSMQNACQWQYWPSGLTVVWDRFTNFYDAFSIQCWGTVDHQRVAN